MPDLRETLETAYDEMNAAPVETTTTEAAPVETATTTEAAPVVEATATPAPETTATESRTRGPDGKFIKADPKATTTATVAAPVVETTITPPVVESKFKAPQSWKPVAREHFAKLPPEVQEEIDRRESEVPRVLQEAAQARKFQEQVGEAFRPYEMLARAAGQHPVQYATGLMQTAAALQTGAPQQRAAVVANIIKTFGVDVEQLAAALDGQAPAQAQQQPPVNVEAIIDQRLQTMREQATQKHFASEVKQFETANEFAKDPVVRRRMAALITAEADAGVEMSLKEAYDQVLLSHPDYRTVTEQRKAAEAAAKAQASTQRAQAASVGIKSQPATAVAAQPKNLRAALEAKYDELASR